MNHFNVTPRVRGAIYAKRRGGHSCPSFNNIIMNQICLKSTQCSTIAIMSSTDLTNQFLIAMPNLLDSNFHKTVTYICAHNNHGAMGIIINRPLELELGKILEQMDISPGDEFKNNQMVYNGGPVHTNHGFILHKPTKEWKSSVTMNTDISITTSRDILEAIASGEGPGESLIALGYAGWDAGQLEKEIMNNAWLNGPSDSCVIFNTPYEERWRKAAISIGVDFDKLSNDVGHA